MRKVTIEAGSYLVVRQVHRAQRAFLRGEGVLAAEGSPFHGAHCLLVLGGLGVERSSCLKAPALTGVLQTTACQEGDRCRTCDVETK